MRLLRGQAEVQLSPKGFTIQRRESVKILPWSRVKYIEVWQYDEPEQRLISFFFKYGRIITIEDQDSWLKAKAIKKWSNDIFAKVPVKTNKSDEELIQVIPKAELLDVN